MVVPESGRRASAASDCGVRPARMRSVSRAGPPAPLAVQPHAPMMSIGPRAEPTASHWSQPPTCPRFMGGPALSRR